MFISSCPAFVRRNLRACIITSKVPTFFLQVLQAFGLHYSVFFWHPHGNAGDSHTQEREGERESLVEGHAS